MSALSVRLGAALRDVREATGTSAAEVARRLGRKQSYISEWESGRKLISLTAIVEVEAALGVALGTVLSRAGFVAAASSTTAALVDDPELSDADRRLMLDVYERCRSRAQGEGRGILDHVQS